MSNFTTLPELLECQKECVKLRQELASEKIRSGLFESSVNAAHAALDVSGMVGKREVSHAALVARVVAVISKARAAQ